MATVLHLYCPGLRPADQAATWAALDGPGWPDDVEVVHCPSPGRYHNARWLWEHWEGPGDLVVVEQDKAVTPALVAELLACLEGHCAFDHVLQAGMPWSELPGGTSMGLAKYTPAARARVSTGHIVFRSGYNDLAGLLAELLGPAHVHRPLVGHTHTVG